MKSKAKRAVQVKFGNVDSYELRMDIVEVYPFKADIRPLIDFDEEFIVVTTTIGMLSGYSLEKLKNEAEERYMSALKDYIKKRWDIISTEDRLKIINLIPLPEVLSPTMGAEEMVKKIEQVSENGQELYANLINTYEYLPD